MTADLQKKCDFFTFHMFADFAAEWMKYYILSS